MKKLLTLLIIAIASLACGRAKNVIDIPVSVLPAAVIAPYQSTDLAQSFLQTLGCTGPMTWSIVESSSPGFQSPRDGAVSQTGVYTAPGCGSIYVGTVQHIQATCDNKVGVAAVASAQEKLGGLAIAVAVVTVPNGTACTAKDPTCIGPSTPPSNCPLSSEGVPLGTTIQYYARLDFTCSVIFQPPLPSPLPTQCTAY